ncbi:hypothetical protein J3P77_20885 [Pseudomonas sp. R1-18]|uniref:hypothetical protein n=1 Tax=Pseudomonas sp. R1-18 TaxID=1632772 RepID=UPI003DAA3317
MIDSYSISGFSANRTVHTLTKTASIATDNTDVKALTVETAKSDEATLSALARQLGDSAVRAANRDASLSPKELGGFGKAVIDKLIGNSYYGNKAAHDAEVPDSNDPELLERAKRATLFTNKTGTNPFTGLSQDQLRLIIYDESGNYTINERKAAYTENDRQEQIWKRAICQRYVDEYCETGKSTETLVMILAHYNELPPIEKAQYPANFAANLTSDDSSAMAIFNRLQIQSAGPEA